MGEIMKLGQDNLLSRTYVSTLQPVLLHCNFCSTFFCSTILQRVSLLAYILLYCNFGYGSMFFCCIFCDLRELSWVLLITRSLGAPPRARLLAGGPLGLLTSSYPPFACSGRYVVTAYGQAHHFRLFLTIVGHFYHFLVSCRSHHAKSY